VKGLKTGRDRKPEGLSEIARPVVMISKKKEKPAGIYAIRTR